MDWMTKDLWFDPSTAQSVSAGTGAHTYLCSMDTRVKRLVLEGPSLRMHGARPSL